METTLRLVWPQLWKLGVLLVLGAGLGMMFAGAAFAQDAAPVAPEASTKDMIDLVFSSAAAGAMSLGAVLLAFLAKHLPGWLTPILDYITTSEADRWEALVTSGLDRAEAYARTKFDAAKDRAGYVNAMATFLAMFNREIVQFADKNGNGIIDLIETRLPPDHSGKKAPPAPDPVQTLMAATQRRGVRTKEVAN